jgi:hypothetical protein
MCSLPLPVSQKNLIEIYFHTYDDEKQYVSVGTLCHNVDNNFLARSMGNQKTTTKCLFVRSIGSEIDYTSVFVRYRFLIDRSIPRLTLAEFSHTVYYLSGLSVRVVLLLVSVFFSTKKMLRHHHQHHVSLLKPNIL